MGALTALGINGGNFFVNLVCFGIAFLIIVKFVLAPVNKMLDRRKSIIEKGLADAAAAEEAKKNAADESQKILNEAKEKSDAILSEAAKKADALKADYKAVVDQQAAKETAIARENINKERTQILSDMRGQIVDIAMNGAKKLVDESLLGDNAKQQKVVSDILSGLRDGKKADFSMVPDGVQKLDVTTAIPLTEDEKKETAALFDGKLSKNVKIQYSVNPAIIGGMILRADEYLLDVSVSGTSEKLREGIA